MLSWGALQARCCMPLRKGCPWRWLVQTKTARLGGRAWRTEPRIVRKAVLCECRVRTTGQQMKWWLARLCMRRSRAHRLGWRWRLPLLGCTTAAVCVGTARSLLLLMWLRLRLMLM